MLSWQAMLLNGFFRLTMKRHGKKPINLQRLRAMGKNPPRSVLAVPPGYSVDEIPDPIKLDMGFAAYQSTSLVKDNVLHYSRTYTVRAVTLPAEKYSDLQKLASVIAADEQNRAVLKKQ